ncbi:unnamed protein product [Cuscuta europaea]|uniref:Transposase (putative) gypsy type domain-containing protein n=1 Tax=Cuscuta europaea TaxID=41803 RepID=A0A9P1E6G8_CUSEU|nr:unnamed protein product [Cuscuta europaea]
MGLRFPLHPFVREYLRYVGLAPCQLTPNNHSYIAGFLHLCRSRGATPNLDLFFQSFNIGQGGHTTVDGFANLQQVPQWRLFSDVPSSHKGWKDRFCYIKMEENPFSGELRNHFRHHPKVESAALEKDGRKISAFPEGSTKLATIKDSTLLEDLYNLGFQRYRFLGERTRNTPSLIAPSRALEVVPEGSILLYLEKCLHSFPGGKDKKYPLLHHFIIAFVSDPSV